MITELAEAARSGDEDAFALLMRENLPRMRAVAISALGYGEEAEDAVQDAVLVALRKLPELREPAAAGAWLTTIVRNNCRMLMRSRRTVPVAEPELLLEADTRADPGRVLERSATRDWVRHAVGALPEPTRDVTVLRYFTSHSSYEQIAELCAVPVSTVRSRLRDGRRALRTALREMADAAHADAGAADAAARAEAEATLAIGERGDFAALIPERYHSDSSVLVAGRSFHSPEAMITMMDYTYGAGVGARVRDVAAGRDVMVWEMDFVNPPDDPEHCPPGIVWLHSLRQGRTRRLRLAYRSTPAI